MKIKVTLNDFTSKEFDSPIKIIDIAKSISPSLAKKVLYGKINNENFPNSYTINKNTSLDFITIEDRIDPSIINEQTLIMIENIIINNFNYLKIIDSSFNEDYFYLDFDCKNIFKEKDLLILKNQINKIVKKFIIDDNKFLIINKNFFNNFKLISLSGIYLDGNKNKKMINRITGFSAINLDALNKKELELNQRLESDHRTIGTKMKLFTFSDQVGKGLPIWLPNGIILKNIIKTFIQKKWLEYDFLEVETPILGSLEMYQTSGHISHYKDDMFPAIKKNGENFMLRPMSCPHHIAIFKNDLHSYLDLPLRYSENAYLFRYEKSGALTGLERVRMMELTDSHLFTDLIHLKLEFKNCFKLIMDVLKTFDIKIDYFSLSLRDKNNKIKFFDDDQMWNSTEKILVEVLDELKINYKTVIGEAAFYGPKLDVQIKSILKHEITISTIQLDMLSAKNFDATYIDESHNKQNPIMIHCGLIGTYERFISILLEQTKGILPLWLMPVQISIIPINQDQDILDYCNEINLLLKKNSIRSIIDNSQERLNYKIRLGQINKIPFQLIIGAEEKNNNKIAVRKYSENNTEKMDIKKFLEIMKKNINISKNIDLTKNNKTFKIDVNYKEFWNNKGINFNKLSKYEKAIECFDKALKIDPNYKDVWNNKGLSLNGLMKYKKAIDFFDKALTIDPNCKEAWNNKCLSLNGLGKYEEAIECLDKALKIDPNFKEALNNMGISFNSLGRYEAAIECFDKALEKDSEFKDALNNKANSLNLLGRYKEALEFFDKTLKINLNLKEDFFNKSNSLNGLGKYKEAIIYLDKALKIDPNYKEAWNNKGHNLNILGKYKEAIECYDKALEIDPNFKEYWRTKGITLNKLGKYKEAIECFDKALKIDPNFKEALNNKNISLYNLKCYIDSKNNKKN